MVASDESLSIDLQDVAKVYRGKVHALRGIEMRVGRGEVFGLLGPNGAGKSTLVKILMTVIRPSRCGGTLLGRPVGHKATLQRVGYLPEHFAGPPHLTGRQTLEYYGALSKMSRARRKHRAAELLEVVGLSDRADRRLATYSKGMMQRIGLAQSLMHEPDLVLLDEPTEGLDPVGRRDVRNVLQRLRDEGRTVFLNSHLLSEIEQVCGRVAILNDGRVVRQGALDELTRAQKWFDFEVGPDDKSRAEQAVGGALSGEAQLGGAPVPAVGGPQRTGALLRVESPDAAGIQPAIDALRTAGIEIRSIVPGRQSLEDLFIETITGPSVPPPHPSHGETT